MKKLMLAACAMAFAGAVQAGQVKWANYGIAAEGCSDMSQAWSGKVYIMDSNAMSAEAFVSAFAANGATADAFNTLVAGALNYATLTSEAIPDSGEYYLDGSLSSPKVGTVTGAAINFGDYAAGTALDLYQVAYDAAGKLFVSEEVSIPATGKGSMPGSGSASAEFYNDASLDGVSYDIAGGYKGEGWYTTSAVPEPTSGLLLLLGVAGLALRRRRA